MVNVANPYFVPDDDDEHKMEIKKKMATELGV